jgi:nucleotide-binding universal stress UspA family protein
MKSILVPIGSSPNSHETLQYAVDFAAEFSAKVYAMEVFSAPVGAGNLTNVSNKVQQISEERLKEVIDKIELKDVKINIATYKGDLVDGIKEINQALGIDLIIIAARCNDAQEELYLGHTTGKIVKQTEIPTLVVPRGTRFTPFKNILTAVRSGKLDKAEILNPLISIKDKFAANVNLLLVKTPGYTEEDLEIHPAFKSLSSGIVTTEHAKTYLGVLEQFQSHHPDMLCVFRRKRGFFKSLWEKNTIPKSEFSSRVPVLILSAKISEEA